jgi:hypothetical protein
LKELTSLILHIIWLYRAHATHYCISVYTIRILNSRFRIVGISFDFYELFKRYWDGRVGVGGEEELYEGIQLGGIPHRIQTNLAKSLH